MKKKYLFSVIAAGLLSLSSCSGFLDQDPDTIITNDQLYSDPVLIKSALAKLYGDITFGQRLDAPEDYTFLDESIRYWREERQDQGRNWWIQYNYDLVRKMNQFLQGLRESTALSDTEKAPLEGEVRLMRAWYYFCSCRVLGGVPIVGDEVFDYTPGMDIYFMKQMIVFCLGKVNDVK